jgi:DNA-binding CsgD family transcriptional regulator
VTAAKWEHSPGHTTLALAATLRPHQFFSILNLRHLFVGTAEVYDCQMAVGRRELSDNPLRSDQRRLLELLAEGMTVEEAARRVFISRRTADRRLAEARIALGVRTTTEAVARLLRLVGRRLVVDLMLLSAAFGEDARGVVSLALENAI